MVKLYIKNMVCSRCKLIVKNEFEKAGFNPVSIELGEVTLASPVNESEKEKINKALGSYGFELIDDRKSRIIEKIKNEIVSLIHHSDDKLKMNLSDHLSDKLNYEYSYLSKLFSEIEGLTIEKYYIEQKIERVKELIVYDELSLGQIAFDMGYSNVAHLSSQFKKVTGLTPSHFKQLKAVKRKSIDEV